MVRKSLVTVAVLTLALLAVPTVAGAHVDIESDGVVAANGTVTATLSVPEECSSATTSIALNFPGTPVLTTVEVAPTAGWSAANTTDTSTGGVTVVTFTGSMGAGASAAFDLILGPIPAGTTSVDFTALQTCADGEVIRWVQPVPADGSEPEFPAPVLTITSFAAGGESTTTSTTTTAATPSTTAAPVEKSDDSSNTAAIVIGIIAAVAVLGGAAFYWFRRKQEPADVDPGGE